MNPWPLTRAEKLETQNGIRKRRMVGQRSSRMRVVPDEVVLMYRAVPMMALSPRDVSHSRGLGSKYRTTTVIHQMR